MNTPRTARTTHPTTPTVAILPWGDLFDDWLDALGVSLAEFRDEFTGSWMFGYARALELHGVRSVIVAVTYRVRRPERHLHGPTGAPLHLLPLARPFRLARRVLLDGALDGRRDPVSIARAMMTHAAPYLATPPIALVRVLRAEGCTAVLCQDYETPRFDVCTALGCVLRVPVFGTFQGGDYQLSRVERPIRPLSLRLATGLIVATRSERERLIRQYGVSAHKLRRIFNPVDVDFWRPQDRETAREAESIPAGWEVVVWHGQVHPRKGLDVLLEAWAKVCLERPDRPLELVLVGGRRGADKLRAEVARLRLRGVRIVDEWVLDPRRIRRLLSAADLYAFPSRHEGFPVAPLEAMACGLPVVASDAQGLPDIFEHGELDGGIVVPRGDAGALAIALGELLDDPTRRRRLATQAQSRIEAVFSLETVGAELAAFLQESGRTSSEAGRG
jgi:glycosyltransferase involved in cell wall biosynthesis